MKIYKNKPRFLIALLLVVAAIYISDLSSQSTFSKILKYGIAVSLFFAGVVQFSDDLLQVGFQEDQVLIMHKFKDTDFIKKVHILDVSVLSNKIYVQTKYENYTIKKSDFGSDDFDGIANDFLKIRAENKLNT